MDGKIHRTHELFYRFHGNEEPAVTEAAVKAFNKPLVAHCGFDAYLASGACNVFAKPDPVNWPNYEGQITTAVHVGINPKVNPSFDSSYEIEREKEDCFGWEHFGDTAKRGFRGVKQSWTLKGLPTGKPLHLAMVVTDQAGNGSQPSNCVRVDVP